MQHIYETDHDFVSIHRQQNEDFKFTFKKAFENYIDGDWVNAASHLGTASLQSPRDGPVRWLIKYLEGNKNLCPEGWKGYRDLDQKQQAPEFDNQKNGDMQMMDQDANPESSIDQTQIHSARSGIQ